MKIIILTQNKSHHDSHSTTLESENQAKPKNISWHLPLPQPLHDNNCYCAHIGSAHPPYRPWCAVGSILARSWSHHRCHHGLYHSISFATWFEGLKIARGERTSVVFKSPKASLPKTEKKFELRVEWRSTSIRTGCHVDGDTNFYSGLPRFKDQHNRPNDFEWW